MASQELQHDATRNFENMIAFSRERFPNSPVRLIHTFITQTKIHTFYEELLVRNLHVKGISTAVGQITKELYNYDILIDGVDMQLL